VSVLGAWSLSSSVRAVAATPAECVAASDRGQAERDDGHLLASRAEFVACAADACPALVKRECSRWLADVEERIPSIVISVKERSGRDLLDAEVSVDGVRVPVAGAGRALPLDPGPHVVRASVSGRGPIEETILARERERDRILTLYATPTSSPEGEDSRSSTARSGKVPLLSWVLAGVAVAGGGAFAYFWTIGTSRVSDLRGSCAPYCTPEQVDDARVPLTTARIALGLGAAAAIGAVAAYLLRPTTPSPPHGRASASSPIVFSF
jgi:hypothetical protein